MRRILLVAGAALSLAACGGGAESEAANDMNALGADNMALDQNMMMDQNMSMDQNGMMANNMGGMDANAATNASTENMMMNDLTTNNPDTNLANGM